MALAPKFAGQKFVAAGSSQAIHTLELCKTSPPPRSFPNHLANPPLDLDYVCPFSKKMFNTVYTSVFPLIEKNYASKVQVIFRQQVQPWHPSSTLVHEAGVAVLRTDPSKFWEFSKALFDKQTEYFDVNVVNETRNATYRRLAKLAATVGLEEGEVYGLLEVGDKPNANGELNIGNKVTNDFKLLIKVSIFLDWIQMDVDADVCVASSSGRYSRLADGAV